MRTENRNTQFRLALHVSAQMRSILLTYAQNHGEVSYNTSYSCGAPQVGFSATIRKIKARTSLLTRFRPPTWLTLETHVQYKRNPARCQFTTVLGVTKMRGLVHPDQNVLNATQNSLCGAVNRRRGCCACRASNCRRRARFSRTRSSREWKALTNQPRKCRSDTIVARIFGVLDQFPSCTDCLFPVSGFDGYAAWKHLLRQQADLLPLVNDCLSRLVWPRRQFGLMHD